MKMNWKLSNLSVGDTLCVFGLIFMAIGMLVGNYRGTKDMISLVFVILGVSFIFPKVGELRWKV